MKNFYKILIVVALTLPVVSHAQFTGTRRLIVAVGDIVQMLILIVGAIALLAFFWGLAKFIFKVGSTGEKAAEEGKALMKWGLIALFVMFSVWGIIGFIQGEFGISRSSTPGGLPGTIPVQNGFPTQLPGNTVPLRPPAGYVPPSTAPSDSPAGPSR